MTKRPIAGRSLLHKDRTRTTTPWCLPPAIAPRIRTRGAWLTAPTPIGRPPQTRSAVPSGDHRQRDEGRVEHRGEGEQDTGAEEGDGPVPLAERGFGA